MIDLSVWVNLRPRWVFIAKVWASYANPMKQSEFEKSVANTNWWFTPNRFVRATFKWIVGNLHSTLLMVPFRFRWPVLIGCCYFERSSLKSVHLNASSNVMTNRSKGAANWDRAMAISLPIGHSKSCIRRAQADIRWPVTIIWYTFALGSY